jgi:HPt (histidine-containing phosphotransfer) domain-containing protein
VNASQNDNSIGATIDPQVIESLRELGGEDDPGLVQELIEMFLQDAPKRMSEIQQGLQTGDIKMLERAAHTLKSSSANLGAMTLSGLCKQMEELARRQDAAAIPPVYEASTRAYAEAASALRSIAG